MKQGRTALNGLLVVVPANDEGSINIEDWETACKTQSGAVASFLTQSNLTGIELLGKTCAGLLKKMNALQ